jgi:hypothetical protein
MGRELGTQLGDPCVAFLKSLLDICQKLDQTVDEFESADSRIGALRQHLQDLLVVALKRERISARFLTERLVQFFRLTSYPSFSAAVLTSAQVALNPSRIGKVAAPARLGVRFDGFAVFIVLSPSPLNC